MFPQLAPGAVAVPFLVAFMLWTAFLDLRAERGLFRREHIWLVLANLALAAVAWAALRPFGPGIALTGFLVAVTPTATAAPAITGMLGGRVAFVAAAALLSNAVIGGLLALLLPLLGSTAGAGVGFGAVAGRIAAGLFAPLIAAQALRRLVPVAVQRTLPRLKQLAFGAWLLALAFATASASRFIRVQAEAGWVAVLAAAAVALIVCIVSFAVGRALGGRELRLECGQSLGQKNNMLTLWLALTFFGPLVALGPVFYALFHNVANAWMLLRDGRRRIGLL
jgi:bile acid:Na+ symporter, BASS family